MEIERQFLVESLPSLPTEYETIRQGYVALEPEIRIRQFGDSHFVLTVSFPRIISCENLILL